MGGHKGPKLGEKARDTVSGWVGVATARYEYLNGCVRWEIAAHDKDGYPKAFVFDEQQLERVEAEPIVRAKRRFTGGPRDSTPVER